MLASINPIALKLFGLEIHWYAIFIVSGVLLGVWLSSREAVRVGLKGDDVTDFILWGLPISIIGARIYYVLFQWSYYKNHLSEIFAIWNGGLAIYGGLIAGFLTLLVFCYHRFIPVWKFLDVVAPSVILAQAIGRWGNFVNQEAFGSPVNKNFLSHTLHLPTFIVENMKIDGVYHQPTFLYESVWNLIGFILLVTLRRKNRFFKEGNIFLTYIAWYSFGRFFIEGLRTDSLMLFGGLRVSQGLSAILFIVAVVLIIFRTRDKRVIFYQRKELL
ncbi:MAG: prolipoprotein diacylglyceryl transferase [Lactobacillales bacterium]|jgi:phosphatidylglycerol:prolipoprotein diacylglycerol transferase|nr:prolipoprotein diacylglyceryl transferase [Lactobacillales bacterium]